MIDLAIIDSFRTISLKDMGKVKLMNRIDTKYVTTLDKIIELLKILSDNYLIQQIEGRSNMPYYTKYFDTPDVQMFYQHQRGKMNRQKVRIRLYEDCHTPPQIENHFYRITLINKEMTERITIDTNLEFHNFITDKALSLDNIGIIEWKRDGHNGKSGFEDILRSLKIQPSGFSKYCIGMAVTNPELRQNRLKPKLRMIKRLASTSRKDANTDNL